MSKVTLGSVSSGSLRTPDLLDAFADALDDLDADGAYADLIQRAYDRVEALKDEDENEDEDDRDLVEELTEALNTFAPPYATFGAHPGDGADVGFWIDEDALQADLHDGTLIQVADLAQIPGGWTGLVLLVNDHGNRSLYRPTVTYEEAWAVV